MVQIPYMIRLRRMGMFVVLATPFLTTACAEMIEPQTVTPTASAGGLVFSISSSSETTAADVDSGYGDYLAGLVAGGSNDLSVAADFMLKALEGDPDNEELLRRSFYLVSADGRHADALILAPRLLDQQPNETIARVVLVVDAVDQGDLEAARTHLEAMPDRGLATVLKPFFEAWLLLGDGNEAAALEAMESLRSRQGIDILSAMHKALMTDSVGNDEDAAAAYQAAIAASGEPSLRLAWLFGNFLERQGKWDEAKALYDQFRSRETSASLLEQAADRQAAGTLPDPIVADYRQGISELLFNMAGLLSQERAEEIALIYTYQALKLRPGFDMAQVLLAETLERQGRYQSALEIYRSVDPKSPFFWVSRLRIADGLERLGREDEAVAELEQLAQERPDHYEPLVRVGSLHRGQERYKEAVEAYDRAFERLGEPESQHWSLLYFRGIALERDGQWDRAEADFLKALELEPEQPYVMNYLAYSWVEQESHLDEALDMLARAVELRPNDGYIVDSLGWVYYRLDRYEEAVNWLEKAVELRPQDPVLNDHLGDAYWQVGRSQEARFQWRRALSLEPEPDTAPKIKSKIDQGLEEEPENI